MYKNFLFSRSGKKLADGKGIGGKGRLTIARIDTMQCFFGLAIRNNKGDSNAMARETRAILKHYSSTPENQNHEDCPTGKSSWCSFNRDKSTNEDTYRPIKNPLPLAVVAEIQPLFDRLSKKEFLAACEEVKTQNLNECYHGVVWSLAPKNQYVSPSETKLAVGIATLLFNQGSEKTFVDICDAIGCSVNKNMKLQWASIDKSKELNRHKRQKESSKKRRKVLKRKKIKGQDAFIHIEGTQYKSGHFHVSS